jgi:hypothetical protein
VCEVSAGGPTRDGRRALDLVAPGETLFATYATNSFWATHSYALIQDGGGYYGWQGATSGASPHFNAMVELVGSPARQQRAGETHFQRRKQLGGFLQRDQHAGGSSTSRRSRTMSRTTISAAFTKRCGATPAVALGTTDHVWSIGELIWSSF